jgi:adenylate cyclase
VAYKGVFFLGCFLAVILATLFANRPWLIQEADHLVYDTMLRTMQREPPSSNVVIVDIDEKSLKSLGQWPWSRYLMTELVTAVSMYHPAALGVDMMLSEQDRTSLLRIREDLQRELNVSVPLESVPPEYLDNDYLLANALRDSPAILGVWFSFEAQENGNSTPCADSSANVVYVRDSETTPLPNLPPATAMKCPIPQLASAVHTTGFLNSLPDSDGRIRRIPLLISMDDRTYPSLALATIMRVRDTRDVFVKVSEAGIESVQVGDCRIPTDQSGNMLLRFSGPGLHFAHVSASDAIGGADLSILKDRIVLIGTSATALKDVQYTPFERAVSGVELHALAIDMMMREEFLHSPSWEQGAQWIVALILGILVAAGVARLSLVWCAVWCIGTGCLSWVGSQWMLANWGVFLSPVPAISVLVGNFLLLTVLRFWHEERRVMRSAKALAVAQSYAINSLTSLAETRDPETGRHIVRTQLYVQLLVRRLAQENAYRNLLTPQVVELMPRCAPLHDIGKVGVPDRILQKPGKLSEDEYDQMKKHTLFGYEALRKAQDSSHVREELPFLRMACEIALTHHERWDGTGYPNGLHEDGIPISGRIMALADVYDALTSKRCYKEGFSHARAVEILTEGRGTHFDPHIVDAFLAEGRNFEQIAKEYADT